MRAALTTAFLVGAAATAVAQPRDEPRPPGPVRAASGALTLDSSRPGAAILGATGLAPGRSTSGEVTIAPSAAAALELRLADLVDHAGPRGGRLSAALELAVTDITDAGRPLTLYAGPLAALATLPLGTPAAGEQRRLRFIATLHDRPGADAVQGATTVASFAWTATELPAPPAPTPPAARPPAGRAPDAALRLRAAAAATQRPARQGGAIQAQLWCTAPCRLAAEGAATWTARTRRGRRARVRAYRRGLARRLARHDGGRRPVRLRLRIPATAAQAVRAGRPVRVTLRFRARGDEGRLVRVTREVGLLR